MPLVRTRDNASITDRYTLYTLIVRVLHALYWKVGRENKRKQIWKSRYITLRISDLQKQSHRFQQRPKLCSDIASISDYQCVDVLHRKVEHPYS